VRTTLRLDDQLLRETKLLAACTGRTVSEVIEEALRHVMPPAEASPPPTMLEAPIAIRWPANPALPSHASPP
jgi:ribbon-helix-helix CopG family protein